MAIIFTMNEISSDPNGECSLVVRDTDSGNYAGLGALNGKIEARLVRDALQRSVADDSFEESRWTEYLKG